MKHEDRYLGAEGYLSSCFIKCSSVSASIGGDDPVPAAAAGFCPPLKERLKNARGAFWSAICASAN